MKPYATILLIALGFVPALAQNRQDNQPTLSRRDNATGMPSFFSYNSALLTAPHTSVIPTEIPTQFNECAITAEEQFHDKEFTDITARIAVIEESTNFARGAIWAIGIVFFAIVGLLGVFWKSIARVVVSEAYPRILNH